MDINKKLKTEIGKINKKYSLPQLLNRYGKLHVTGSYVYDLMAWKDYDVVLEMDKLDNKIVYSLIKDIGLSMKPQELKILDNCDKHNKNRPQGYWVGIYIDDWKIDLWIMDKKNASKEVIQTEKLVQMLKNVNKSDLISLKSKLAENPDYHKKFSSVDLYNAYVCDNVRTVEQFYKWLKNKS